MVCAVIACLCLFVFFPDINKTFLISFYNISDTDVLNTHIKNKTQQGIEVSTIFCVKAQKG